MDKLEKMNTDSMLRHIRAELDKVLHEHEPITEQSVKNWMTSWVHMQKGEDIINKYFAVDIKESDTDVIITPRNLFTAMLSQGVIIDEKSVQENKYVAEDGTEFWYSFDKAALYVKPVVAAVSIDIKLTITPDGIETKDEKLKRYECKTCGNTAVDDCNLKIDSPCGGCEDPNWALSKNQDDIYVKEQE